MQKTSGFAVIAAVTTCALAASAQQPPAEPAEREAAPPEAAPAAQPAEAPAEDATPEAPAATPAEAEPLPDATRTEPTPATDDVGLDPVFPDPSADAQTLTRQGDQAPGGEAPPPKPRDPDDEKGPTTDRIFAEDWWTHTRPIFEIHGLFRTRAELFHNFSLGRLDPPDSSLWPPPSDNAYEANGTPIGPALCNAPSSGVSDPNQPIALVECRNESQAGANLRLSLRPELHISDNLRVMSRFDFLDNARLGSTPSGYAFQPAAGGGYAVSQPTGYYGNGVLTDTQSPPQSGVNSLEDAVRVVRAWGEYTTPVGELRFGRMPHHWGLGMLYNAGDGYDHDYTTNVDRITFITGFKPLDLVLAGSWDFPNEGPGATVGLDGAPEYDRAQYDDVDQWTLTFMRRVAPELTRQSLSQGNVVINAGTYLVYRQQFLANDTVGVDGNAPGASGTTLANGFARRGAKIFTPDLWVQFLYKKFRFEAEAALVVGGIESTTTVPDNRADFANDDANRDILQFGITTQIEQTLLEDQLHLDFNFGYATGDGDAFDGSTAGDLIPGPNEQQVADKTISTFRFNPNYQVDLILNRHILNRVQGTYYFRPSVAYDFIRDDAGQRAGGRATVIWTRATEFVQTPGHDYDLGVELNGTLYYQSKDGALNDDPDELGGFYTMLQYGVMFPLGGLQYQSRQNLDLGEPSISPAQILRWYLGVLF